MSRNTHSRDNSLVRDGLRELRRRLPPGWTLSEASAAAPLTDATAELTAPDRRKGTLALEARRQLDPKGVSAVVDRGRSTAAAPLIVVSPYLSAATRDRLRERDLGYVDLTGNVRVVIAKPGLYIQTEGASENPEREERPARSLRGAKAGRIVRALVDSKRPLGVRELATATKIDPGYVSRVLALLDSEALITRVGHGRTDTVDWPSLLRRWSRDAPLEARGRVRTYLEPRGVPALLARLAKSDERYAVTGALAAARMAPTAPARLAAIWLRDTAEAAVRLGLRPTDSGANVLLLDPADDSAFEGATRLDGIWYASPSQVAADLLTSPGRGPNEGEELIEWMRAHEEAWRR